MNEKRRIFLKSGAAAGLVSAALGAGLLAPRAVLAQWNESAFRARGLDEALGAMGETGASDSDQISIKAPAIAENGAVVPVTVESTLEGAESISIYVEQNATPMTAHFMLSEASIPYVSTRIKMGKTSNVVALVKAGGKLHQARQEVKVTIGGCGG